MCKIFRQRGTCPGMIFLGLKYTGLIWNAVGPKIKSGNKPKLDKLPPLQANQLFELALEPAAGSPIGRPTGPIQLIGRAVKVL